MERESVILGLFLLVFSFTFISAETSCDLSISLLNQDPYPAIPGDYVKLLFQVGGLQDPSCGDLSFELLEKYPITLDDSTEKIVNLNSGTFVKSFASHATIAYKVRVDSDAMNGDNPIEIAFSNKGASSAFQSKEFNLFVEDTRADFEVYVKNFDYTTNEITLEILNIADVDVKSITLELLETEDISIKGSRTKIIGDLDSNEYTTTDFEVSPITATLLINVYYTDNAGFRRIAQETVLFNPEYFSNRKTDQKTTSIWTYVLWIVILGVAGYWLYKRQKAKKLNK